MYALDLLFKAGHLNRSVLYTDCIYTPALSAELVIIIHGALGLLNIVSNCFWKETEKFFFPFQARIDGVLYHLNRYGCV